MAFQQGQDVPVSYKLQAALGTEEAAGSGATKWLYKEGSPGFSPPDFALIQSTTNFGDGMTTRGRQGTYNVPGQMNWEALAGDAHDLLYEMAFRNAHDAAVTVTEATAAMSSATLSVSSNVITFSAGSVITAGISVQDVVIFASGLDAADNGTRLRVKAVTATTITVYETITDVAGPVAAYSFTRGKRLIQAADTDRIITVDQYLSNIDLSVVLSDVKAQSVNFALGENTTLDVTGNFLGAGYAYKATGASPHFTSPTEPTGDSLAFLDACFAINGGAELNVTGFNLGIDVPTQTLAVANKTGKSPDVFQGNGKPTGQFTMPVEDFNELSAAAGETQIDFAATFLDPNGTGYRHIAVTNAIMTGAALSPLGQVGAMLQTFNLEIGRDAQGGAYDKTGIKMLSAA